MGQILTYFFKKTEDKKAVEEEPQMEVTRAEETFTSTTLETLMEVSDFTVQDDNKPQVLELVGSGENVIEISSPSYHSINESCLEEVEERLPSFISPVKVRMVRAQ